MAVALLLLLAETVGGLAAFVLVALTLWVGLPGVRAIGPASGPGGGGGGGLRRKGPRPLLPT